MKPRAYIEVSGHNLVYYCAECHWRLEVEGQTLLHEGRQSPGSCSCAGKTFRVPTFELEEVE